MIRTILGLLFLVTVVFGLSAQAGRYLSEVFDEVTVSTDVVYGVNATVLSLQTVGEAIPQELKMDVYEPAGDNFDFRPLVMVYHTGFFLPPVINGGIEGARQDSSVVEICTRLAKAGYVAAAVDYRLGWNPVAASQPERNLSFVQALYRGIQDGRTCIRYFKKNYAEGGNTYGIDTTRMGIWGIGTGGYISLGMTSLNAYEELLTTTNGPGKFLFDPGNGIPIPMVLEAYHGDIEGKVLTIAPDDAFGFPAGDTTNYTNHVAYSSDFQFCVNIGGAIGDISWLNQGEPPIITVQSAYDMFTPYDEFTLVVPGTADPVVRLQGGLAVSRRQDELGHNDIFTEFGVDNVWTDAAIANSATAGHSYLEGLYPITNPPNSFGLDEGVAIGWWDPNGPPPPASGTTIPWNMLPHPSGGTFHDQGLMLNEGMSAEKARTNIDTIMGYFYPRAYCFVALHPNTENIKPSEVSLTITPNPVGNEILLQSAIETPMRSIRIYDMSGRLVRYYEDVDFHSYFISRGNLTAGTYIITTEFDEGLASKKIILR